MGSCLGTVSEVDGWMINVGTLEVVMIKSLALRGMTNPHGGPFASQLYSDRLDLSGIASLKLSSANPT